MTRSLYASRPSPYYIYSLDYRRTSAGIRVMHALCDALIRSGHEAYVRANVLNPQLMTPRLTDEVVALHREHGIEPIVVYPEVIFSNPLAGNVVVRYLLNRPGFLKSLGDEEYGSDDIIYAYTQNLVMPGQPDDQVMFMPPFDRRVFRMPEDPAVRVPGKVCFYQGRGGQAPIDPALLGDDAVEITSKWPACWEDMAALFQQCEFFYCAESSALAGEAALCGCISVIVPSQWATVAIGKDETKGYGVAWGLEPEQLAWARETLPLLQQRMIDQEAEFWTALDGFVQVTQQAARNYMARPKENDVQRWLAPRVLLDAQVPLAQALIERGKRSCIEFVILHLAGDEDALARSLESIASYAGPGREALSVTVVEHLEQLNEHLVSGEAAWFGLLKAGETLVPSGLLSLLLKLARLPSDARALFGDAILCADSGEQSLLLRPDMNLDLLLSCPSSMARNWLFERSAWQRLGGFCLDFPQCFEFAYILRLIEDQGLSGLEHFSEPLVSTALFDLAHNPDEQTLIEQHLRLRGFDEASVQSRLPGCYDLNYRRTYSPVVSIVVVIDGRLVEAQRCVDSLLENTTYARYELLLVDRGNQETSILSWLSGIEQLGIEHLHVLRGSSEDSIASLRNAAAAQCAGEYLLFLDAGIGIVGSDWLQQLLNHAVRPEVAAVGAKLVDANGGVRQAGMILGLDGVAGSPYKDLALHSTGYMQRLQLDQNCSALSDECLMVRSELFESAGGFDEALAPWSDVDLSLRLQQLGYLNVWTPRTQLVIKEQSASLPAAEQQDLFYDRWLPWLASDPAYNANLSLRGSSAFRPVEGALSWRPFANCPELPTVLVQPKAGFASSSQRVIVPLQAFEQQGWMTGAKTTRLMSMTELERYQPDVVILHRQMQADEVQNLQRMKRFSRAFKVYDLDTFLPGLDENTLYGQKPEQVHLHLKIALSCMDRVLVSNAALAQVLDGSCSDIRVVDDVLEPGLWSGLVAKRRTSTRPRIGWVGRKSHAGDLQVIGSVIEQLAGQVEWVVLGVCPEALRPFVDEVHKPVPYADYPASLAALNLDLALAPLEETLFNRCRGRRRLLEYAACGYPVICTDLEPFHGDLPVTRVKNTHEAWLNAIRAYLGDLDSAALLGDHFRARVLSDSMLQGDVLQAWRSAWLPG